jgi:threonine/homoserine/homoserine lactone efflux protein
VLGSLYLFWLAFKITTASIEPQAVNAAQSNKTKPMTLFSAATFQFVNPKAWAMTIGSIGSFTFAGEGYIASGLWIMLCFAITGFIAISLCLSWREHSATIDDSKT